MSSDGKGSGPYLVHLTLAQLLTEPQEFQKFLDSFPRNDEIQKARDSWLESKEGLMNRLKGVGIETAIEHLSERFNEGIERSVEAIEKLSAVRQTYLSDYHIPEYVINLHKDRKIQSARWHLENLAPGLKM